MKRLERIRKITKLLEKEGNASTVFLAQSLNVSESSIRRDINQMTSSSQNPRMKRIHGGIVLDHNFEGLEYMFELKLEVNCDLKKKIAIEASKHICDGDHIIIDSGTTCYYLAQQLFERKRLCVMTLDVKISEVLGKYADIESNIIGGLIRPGYYTIGGSRALENLDRFSASKVFMSVDAVDIDHGVTNASEFEVGVKEKLLKMGKKIYVMADYKKINTHTLYKVADITMIDTIITNKELDEQCAELIRGKGLELIMI